MHHMQDPQGPNGPVAYSEVFAGRFDHKRLTAWLEANSESREPYADRTIYMPAQPGTHGPHRDAWL